MDDGKAGDILRSIEPYFREGNFDAGLAFAFNQLADYSALVGTDSFDWLSNIWAISIPSC